MGYVKEKMIEMEENGDWPSSVLRGKYVCTHHFQDQYLNDIIKRHGRNGQCTYCGRKDIVCDMMEFGQHIAFKIGMYFSPIEDANLMLADSFYDDDKEVIPGMRRIGPYVAPEGNTYYESKEEMMNNLSLYTDDAKLNSDIESIFTTEQWISKDFYEEDKNVKYSNQWDRFVDFVSKKRRFTFLASPEYISIVQEDGKKENILSVLRSLIIKEGLVVKLNSDTKLYRARRVDDIRKNYEFKDITSPPDASAFPNRMSPAGVSMFYASFEKETAKKECVGEENQGLIVGEFETKKDLLVIDFTKIPTEISFWMDDWQANQFLYHFNEKITKKISPNDKNLLQYVPTQVFTEYLRYMFKDVKGRAIDGMIYGSSKTKERNIVLFCNQKDSEMFVNTNVRIEKYVSKQVWKPYNNSTMMLL